jgi:hypothetical protein
VLLLLTKAEGTLMRYPHANLGRLVQPRHYDNMAATVRNRRPWAADNDCFQGLDPDAYRRMLQTIPTGGLFVTVPDVVADHRATLRRWRRWAPYVRSLGHRPAFVLQDGCDTFRQVPADADAVFIGGSTVYKFAPETADIIAAANHAEMWTHMGRVNTRRRIRYAKAINCRSVDGTAFARFTDAHIGWGLAEVSAATQGMLVEQAAEVAS